MILHRGRTLAAGEAGPAWSEYRRKEPQIGLVPYPSDTHAAAPSWRAGRTACAVATGLVLLFGVWLRLDRITLQTPHHDERHALVAAAHGDFARHAARFGAADLSIPVVLYLEVASRMGRLDELATWGPFVATGLLALLWLGLLARPSAGEEAAWALVALLAIAPLLVYYGRAARPYGVVAPVALASVLLLARWWRHGGRRRAALFVLAAVTVGWAMPVYLPFLLAPSFVLLGAVVLDRRRREADAIRTAKLVAATLGLLAAALALPLLSDAGSLMRKSNAPLPDAPTLLHAARLVAGLGSFAGLTVAVALALVGCGLLLRRGDRHLFVLLAAAAGGQLAALLAVRPAGFHDSAFVAARYLLPVGLEILLLAAVAAGALARRARPGRWVLAAGLVILCVARWGPAMPLLLDRADSFRSTRLYHLLFFAPGRLLADFPALPAAYSALDSAERGAIVEVPYDAIHRTPYTYYQHLHGRDVFVGVHPKLCGFGELEALPVAGAGGFRLSRLVSLTDGPRLRSLGVRFIVVHRAVESEVPWTPPERLKSEWSGFHPCLDEIERRTGVAPVTADGIALFDLGPPAGATPRSRAASDREREES